MRPDQPTSPQTPPPDVAARPNPRAFAIGTGAMYQTLGVCLFLGGCGLWALSGRWVTPDDGPAANWWDFFATRFGAAVWTIGLLTSAIYGLALATAGLGLQGERPDGARLGVVVNVVACAAYAAIAVLLIVAEGSVGLAAIPLVLALVAVGLLLFAIRCLSILRRFPPPPDLSRATPEILEEYRRKREERYRSLD